jgi:hypothetical protein
VLVGTRGVDEGSARQRGAAGAALAIATFALLIDLLALL